MSSGGSAVIDDELLSDGEIRSEPGHDVGVENRFLEDDHTTQSSD